MRPFTTTIPFEEARRIVMDAVPPMIRTERVPLTAADGRVAARDVAAVIDVPPFDRAAMDGYAVIAEDTREASTHAPAVLTCVGQILTGAMPTRPVQRGECIEIATGAPMPAGADAVVMVEDTATRGHRIEIRAAAHPRQHVGARAADIQRGQSVVSSGQLLGPARIGALAATGVSIVEVYARPSIMLISSGDEITEPGLLLPPGHIYDVNRFTLAAVFARHGGAPVTRPTVPDAIETLTAALDEGLTHDLVVLSGGSSVGEHDFTLDVVRARGEVVFHGVAVRPGKPTLFARAGAVPIFGLSGYPTSCLVNAYVLVVPFLRAMARLPPWEPRTIELPLARRVSSVAGRHQFYTVRIAGGAAEPAFKASGDITSMANADGYIEIPAATEAVEAGTVVQVICF